MTNQDQKAKDIVLALNFLIGMGSGYLRERGADLLVLAGMHGTSDDNKWTLEEITDNINSNLTESFKFRRQLVGESLKRLKRDGLINTDEEDKPKCFWHTEESINSISSEIENKKELMRKNMEKIAAKVKERHVLLTDEQELLIKSMLKEFLCELFEKFGHQTAMMIVGRFSGEDFLRSIEVREIINSLTRSNHIQEPELVSIIHQEFINFLTEEDPDTIPLKFHLAQNYYLLKLLGIDPNTPYLAEDAFKDSHLILDSNVIITSLLSESRPYKAFQEFVKLSRDLKIKTIITNFTVEEIDRVVTRKKEEARLYYVVPPDMVKEIRDSFYRTWIERKKDDSSFTTSDLFEPFDQIPVFLEEQFDVEYQNALKDFDECYEEKKFEHIKEVVEKKSKEVRWRLRWKKSKTPPSVEHDSIHYLIVEHRRKEHPKTWFLTLDTSLPFVSEELMGKQKHPFCFTLNSWLECMSPFVTTETSRENFSLIFSNVLHSILFPLQQVFDVTDFAFFDAMDINVKEMLPEIRKETLLHFKSKILKGNLYDPKNVERYAYEMANHLRSMETKYADDKEKTETIKNQGNQINAFQKELIELKSDQGNQIDALQKELSGLKSDQGKTNEKLDELKELKKKVTNLEKVKNWAIFGGIIVILGLIGYFVWWPALGQMGKYEKPLSVILLLVGGFYALSFPAGWLRTWKIWKDVSYPIIGFLYILYELFK